MARKNEWNGVCADGECLVLVFKWSVGVWIVC